MFDKVSNSIGEKIACAICLGMIALYMLPFAIFFPSILGVYLALVLCFTILLIAVCLKKFKVNENSVNFRSIFRKKEIEISNIKNIYIQKDYCWQLTFIGKNSKKIFSIYVDHSRIDISKMLNYLNSKGIDICFYSDRKNTNKTDKKICYKCNRLYDDDHEFCEKDGYILLPYHEKEEKRFGYALKDYFLGFFKINEQHSSKMYAFSCLFSLILICVFLACYLIFKNFVDINYLKVFTDVYFIVSYIIVTVFHTFASIKRLNGLYRNRTCWILLIIPLSNLIFSLYLALASDVSKKGVALSSTSIAVKSVLVFVLFASYLTYSTLDREDKAFQKYEVLNGKENMNIGQYSYSYLYHGENKFECENDQKILTVTTSNFYVYEIDYETLEAGYSGILNVYEYDFDFNEKVIYTSNIELMYDNYLNIDINEEYLIYTYEDMEEINQTVVYDMKTKEEVLYKNYPHSSIVSNLFDKLNYVHEYESHIIIYDDDILQDGKFIYMEDVLNNEDIIPLTSTLSEEDKSYFEIYPYKATKTGLYFKIYSTYDYIYLHFYYDYIDETITYLNYTNIYYNVYFY